MNRALLVANKAFFNFEYPVGAILVYNNFELSFSLNCFIGINHVHCEAVLLKRFGFYFLHNVFYKSILYVTMEPCFNCFSFFFSFKVNKIIFGSYSFYRNYLFFSDKFFIKGGILEIECNNLLKKFFLR